MGLEIIPSRYTDLLYKEQADKCIGALRDKIERDKGCGYCIDGVYYDVLGSPCKYNYCPMCGKRLINKA